jgi:hypothetical protein
MNKYLVKIHLIIKVLRQIIKKQSLTSVTLKSSKSKTGVICDVSLLDVHDKNFVKIRLIVLTVVIWVK